MSCMFKTYHFQTWQVYPLKTLLTKQKIRQKQLAFSRYFKQRNRHSSEIRRFFGGGQVSRDEKLDLLHF